MAAAAKDITFVIPGQTQPPDAAGPTLRGTLKASVRVGAQRGPGDQARITARPGEDVVVLTIANGPTLVLHPQDARDLMRAQTGAATRSAIAAADDEVPVPVQLAWPGLEAAATRGATRGWMGQAILSAFEVVTGLGKDAAVSLVSAAVTQRIDGAVHPGVYELSPDPLPGTLKDSGFLRSAVAPAEDGGPLLVLVHGTFVDTVSTFGKLWAAHPQTVRALFAHYNDRVYALDHPTMGASPIANALTLAEAMPPGARLHLLTHSRGGLVAEVLARACGGSLESAELDAFAYPKYAGQLPALKKLVKLVQTKGLKVERMVRVACPARGTTLASKRLDAYLSVLRWGLQLAGVPVAPDLVEFLHEVARRRSDPSELPGLEAMMPGSAVVAWLNGGGQAIPGELRVVAGDIEGDSVVSWVKTLLSDAFYWTDNDLVVQTRSMYGGVPRDNGSERPGAIFLLDRGAQVSHFNYFANDRTVSAIANALMNPGPEEFAGIGPLSWAGQDASGIRAARAVARSRGGPGGNPANRPAVFVLPGILGSHLKLDGKRIWLGLRFLNGLKRLAWDPATADRVAPDGPIGSSYDDLIERLADTHEVIPFAYDWRRPIEDEARRLATEVDAALTARASSGQPVRLLAHSMGGLVARTMQLEAPDTWKRLMARAGSRLLMLGTPNGGSWAPMQTLSGDDTFGNALVAFGSLFDNSGARKMMAGMPGFIQLQASLLDAGLGLDKAATWKKLADDDMAALRERSIWHDEGVQQTIYEWGAPPQEVLDRAVALRRRLDAQVSALGADAQKMLLVVGHAAFTPAGIVLDAGGLSYLDTPAGGDGRVTLASAMLPGVATWQVEAEHGKLPDVDRAFAAYIELLTRGETSLLDPLDPLEPVDRAPARGAAGAADPARTPSAGLVRSRPSRGLQRSEPPSSQADVLGTARAFDSGERGGGATGALQVVVLNADLKFVQQPLLIGHYQSIGLGGSEAAIDALVGSGLSRALNAGLYPEAPGSHQIFENLHRNPDNPFQMPRPKAAIVVGLGEEGKLRFLELVFSVRQAVLAYSQRLSEHEGGPPAQFDIATTLMGSGGRNITPGEAARGIAQGVMEANLRAHAGQWPTASRLTIVEVDLERASDAWRALHLQENATPGNVKLMGKIQFGPGAIRRSLDSSYRGSNHDLLSALYVPGSGLSTPCIAYTLATRRARTEVRAQHTQGALLRELVKKASNDGNTDTQIGRTLFNLLIPVELEAFFSGTSEMVIELQPETAGIPWELLIPNPDRRSGLDRRSADERPWAIRSKLIRKLQTREFRSQVLDATPGDDVLVIGEPETDPVAYPPLPGARREAIAVAAQLTASGNGIAASRVKTLVGKDDAHTIINALFERRYRIVHIAGHGEFGASGGVVLSGRHNFLGANEVNAMRTVPELVFLNCCHLAGRDAAQTLRPYDRAAFAANIAEALIKVGVRCVIAAGWAVEDDAAEKFATSFYAALLGGARFIDAVGRARTAAWNANKQGNTWAAYQCYGDAEWTWRRDGADPQRPATPLHDEYSGIASPVALVLALEAIATRGDFGGATDKRKQAHELELARLHYLESEFAPVWRGMGAVAEAFGVAYASVGERDEAIGWLREAIKSDDGSASLKAAEQLGNLLVRRAGKLSDPDAARRDIEAAIVHLETLVALEPTRERENLLGSAYKRLTVVETRANREPDAKAALEAMVRHYGAAEAMARKAGADDIHYPAKNIVSAELRAAFLEGRAPQLSDERMSALSDSLKKAVTERPDFWSVVGQTELLVLVAISKGRLAAAERGITSSLRELKLRVSAPRMWDSVYNEAQFTLEAYAKVAVGAEQAAARKLLDALEEMARHA